MNNIPLIQSLKKCIIQLNNRSIIKVVGKDALKHLNGLTTNHLIRLKDNQSPYVSSQYNGFLAPNGRLLFDSIISLDRSHYGQGTTTSLETDIDAFLIDIDKAVSKEAIDHLKQYKMRNKIDIIDVSDQYNLYSILDKTYKTVRDKDQSLVELESQECSVIMDPRHDIMGLRILMPKGVKNASELQNGLLSKFTQLPEEYYHLFRLSQGIAEGVEECQYSQVIPLEYNFDLLNGVDFHKGCYLGQELTSRTHFTGLIRKRVFPVVMKVDQVESVSVMDEALLSNESVPPKESHLFPLRISNSLSLELPPKDSVLSVKNNNHTEEAGYSRSQDKFVSGQKSVGLAMLKLDNIDIFQLDNTTIKDQQQRDITLLPPCWLSKVTNPKQPIQEVS
ncbi:putative mitochondrial transferase [Tieghemostelium lacteum]|uniref:Putative mitochondrial transferase n=1 Tax=Tieghemostelium lacteum TaxID=361077 RepID=A0A151ZJW9_TIELA|nr:putative mitochondrial transferase [Tieghemostelium lacteum]|eukprot:KYQ94199.1 putative mitochondrial transferase [Tieghemostelium lacteum]